MDSKLKILILSLVTLLSLTAGADDSVTCTIQGFNDGIHWLMPIKLVNSTKYVAYQMDIDLPAGVTIESVTPNSKRLATGSESSSFVIDYGVLDATTNVVRVIAYNLSNSEVLGTSGDVLMTLHLKSTTAKTLAEMNTTSFNDIIFIKSTGLSSVNISGQIADGVLLGDANSDGSTNVSDLSAVVGYILNTNVVSSFNRTAADVNNDGSINVSDLSGIVSIILGTFLK